MQHVTAQTATALRDAGFPQPEFATGQIWYNLYGAASFIGRKDCDSQGNTTFFCTSLRTGTTDEIRLIKDVAIFAPTAADILRELGDGATIVYHQDVTPDGMPAFQVWADGYMKAINKSPAEACAKAWLAKNAQFH